MAVPDGYRRLEGSGSKLVPEARRIGHEDPDAPLSVTIQIKPDAGHPGRDRVEACALRHGLRVDRTTVTEQIVVSGTVAQINATFAIELGIYATARRSCRGFEGFLHLPEEIAHLVAEVTGLIEHGIDAGGLRSGPTVPGRPGPGSSQGGSSTGVPPRVVAHWTVPHKGPSGPVTPGNYSMVSSFDVDWLTPGFQSFLDNLAASPGAFTAVRVMKVLNSGTAELGPAVSTQAPAADGVWPYAPAGPDPIGPDAFAATLKGLTELTERGLVPYVVLGFFPAGVYSGTTGGQPSGALGSVPYGPSPQYLEAEANSGDWGTILENWSTLVQAFFQALYAEFGSAIGDWWFEVWNEPDSPTFWLPDSSPTDLPSAPGPLGYYCQLYKETLVAIAAGLPAGLDVRVGGPTIMANTYTPGDEFPAATGTDLQAALPVFLDFVYYGGFPEAQATTQTPLKCDFVSLHAKGNWRGFALPDLSESATTGVIYTIESAVKDFMSLTKYHGYFAGKPIVNNEADMRVGVGVPFYPRMTSQYPAWLTALMIASDSLSSQYASTGAQFVIASDNAHPELIGWQQPADPDDPGSMNGGFAFGQQRSIMTAASSWDAGTTVAPACPQDLLKLPVYNFYELLRLLGDQHGVFVSGQGNFYPTNPDSSVFSAITVGAPAGELTHVCWLFCIYPTTIPSPEPGAHAAQDPFVLPSPWSTEVEVIGLPATPAWESVNWVQFQIGKTGELSELDSFTVATASHPEKEPPPIPPAQNQNAVWEYDVSVGAASSGPGPTTQVSVTDFDANNVRMHQEVGLVQYLRDVKLQDGAWTSPGPVDFEPYSCTALWITPYDQAHVPAAPTDLVATEVGQNVVLTWKYPQANPQDPSHDPSFFYFEVLRDGATISPVPALTPKGPAWSFALRAAIWVDTGVLSTSTRPPTGRRSIHTYSVVAYSASGKPSAATEVQLSF